MSCNSTIMFFQSFLILSFAGIRVESKSPKTCAQLEELSLDHITTAFTIENNLLLLIDGWIYNVSITDTNGMIREKPYSIESKMKNNEEFEFNVEAIRGSLHYRHNGNHYVVLLQKYQNRWTYYKINFNTSILLKTDGIKITNTTIDESVQAIHYINFRYDKIDFIWLFLTTEPNGFVYVFRCPEKQLVNNVYWQRGVLIDTSITNCERLGKVNIYNEITIAISNEIRHNSSILIKALYYRNNYIHVLTNDSLYKFEDTALYTLNIVSFDKLNYTNWFQCDFIVDHSNQSKDDGINWLIIISFVVVCLIVSALALCLSCYLIAKRNQKRQAYRLLKSENRKANDGKTGAADKYLVKKSEESLLAQQSDAQGMVSTGFNVSSVNTTPISTSTSDTDLLRPTELLMEKKK